jgi:hypothetical protein
MRFIRFSCDHQSLAPLGIIAVREEIYLPNHRMDLQIIGHGSYLDDFQCGRGLL